MNVRMPLLLLFAALPGPALAGEAILYQPAPAWVIPAKLPESAGAASPAIVVYDVQQKVEGGTLWQYLDTATRIASPEQLGQLSTIALQWSPDKGDIVIHEMAIVRGGQTIDLLASGKKFDVLRREELLEQRQLTGLLSATMAVEGLRVGDVFRLRYSTTMHDKVLGERVQSVTYLPARPLVVGSGKLRMVWPAAQDAKWQFLAKNAVATPRRVGATMELEMPLPLAKMPEVPEDAPVRYASLPLFEFSTFAGWPDVSRTFEPLYRTKGLIADGTPLAAEADNIAKASADPLVRTQAALQLVQDQVRYFLVAMNAGNYTPQSPEETWKLRYGDCKAKTLLLLALLHRLGIEAEAVLAKTQGGHDLTRHLPSAAAFDHVLVRATVGGQVLWLDGTALGDRIEDIHDTPDIGYVLPLRTAGAEPELIQTHANARPTVEMEAQYDESASTDLPSVVTAKMTIRGAPALSLGLAAQSLDPEQREEMIRGQMRQAFGEGEFVDLSLETSADTATAVVRGRGIVTTPWQQRERQRVRRYSSMLSTFTFAPDRARAEWRDIPVATASPVSIVYHLRVKLPDGGKGFTLEGAPDIDATAGGARFVMHAALADGSFVYDERRDNTGLEVPTAQIGVDRTALTKAQARMPLVVAPADTTRRWNLAKAAKGATQQAGIDAVLTKSMAVKDPEADPWGARARLRKGTGDFKGAREDLTKALALSEDAATYLARANVNRALGDLPAAIADARKSQEIDPSELSSTALLASLLAQSGALDEARTILADKVALGGEQRKFWEATEVETLGLYGDSTEALSMLDTMMTARPQNPGLLNLACWIKGMRGVDVDAAVRQCASAVELASNSTGPLDSRAVVWFRLGRFDDALHDLDAVLLEAPAQEESRYMRGIVLARLGRAQESSAEIAVARRINPGVDALYTRVGIKP
jgi:tetratricopeptide (TPR) repeat protein